MPQLRRRTEINLSTLIYEVGKEYLLPQDFSRLVNATVMIHPPRYFSPDVLEIDYDIVANAPHRAPVAIPVALGR